MDEHIREASIADLVRMSKAGSEQALAALFAYFAPDIKAIILKRRVHANDLEDAAQACLLCIHRCVLFYKFRTGREPFQHYVRAALVRNTARMQDYVLPHHSYLPLEGLNGHEPGYEDDHAREEVQEALQRLTVPCRELVEAYFFKGRTLAEIAAVRPRHASHRMSIQQELEQALATMKRMME